MRYTYDFSRLDEDLADDYCVKWLLGLLGYFFEDFSDEIITALKAIPNAQHLCIMNVSMIPLIAANRVMKAILDLGAENTDHLFLMQCSNHHTEYRETIKLVINTNPEIQDGTDVVEAALQADLRLPSTECVDQHGVYYTDH